MPEYRRFISYFYEYIDGKKQKNAGFAKVELRNGMWRILLRIAAEGCPDSSIQVYGFTRESKDLVGILLGEIRPVQQIAEEWAFRADAPIGKGKYGLGDLAGIWVESSGGRRFITVWDDEGIDVERFVAESSREDTPGQLKESVPGEQTEAEAEQPGKSNPKELIEAGADLAERADVSEVSEGGSEERIEVEADLAERADVSEVPEGDPGEQTEAEAEQPGESDPKEQIEAGTDLAERADVSEVPEGGPGEQTEAEAEQPGESDPKEQIEAGADLAETADASEVPEGDPGEQAELKAMSGGEKDGLAGTTFGARQVEAAACSAGEQQSEMKERGAVPEELFRRRAAFRPFADARIESCVMILPCDIVRLQQDNWSVGRSSFLQHGFYQYRHLLLGKDSEGNYILGVPGIRNPQEAYMAKMFGYESFRESVRPDGSRNFGYWCRELRHM